MQTVKILFPHFEKKVSECCSSVLRHTYLGTWGSFLHLNNTIIQYNRLIIDLAHAPLSILTLQGKSLGTTA